MNADSAQRIVRRLLASWEPIIPIESEVEPAPPSPSPRRAAAPQKQLPLDLAWAAATGEAR